MTKDTTLWPQNIVDYGVSQAMLERPFIIDGPEISKQELMQASNSIARIIKILASFPERTGKSLYDMACWLGFKPDEALLLIEGCENLDPEPYARADVIRTKEGIKIVEVNMGALVGGLIDGALPFLSGSFQPHNPMSEWINYLSGVIPCSGRGIIVYDGPEGSEWNAHIQIMANKLSQTLNIDISAARKPDLEWNGSHLCDEKGRIDWIHPIYFPWQVTSDKDYYQPIRTAIRHKAVSVPVHPSSLLLSSKKMFAWLWQCIDNDILSAEEVELVKSVIPYTSYFTNDKHDFYIQNKDSLVLKPSNGYCGLGVIVGHEVNMDTWQRELETALASGDDYILQECCDPILEKTITIDKSKQREEFLGRYIWGMFVANGKFCGTPFLRCREPSGSLVINAANGASCGPLPQSSSIW